MTAPRCNVTPLEALRRLIAEVKQLDAVEVGARWNQLQGELGVAEGVVRDAQPVIWVSPDEVPHEDNGVLYETNRQILLIGSTEGPFGGYTVPLYGDCAPVAAQPSEVTQDGLPWAIAEFWSSANPGRKVRMLAEGDAEIKAWGKRGDFIRWAYPAAPAAAGSAAPSGEVQMPEPKEGEKGWRPACCDGGEEGSSCCDGGCAANQELAELRRAAITATKE